MTGTSRTRRIAGAGLAAVAALTLAGCQPGAFDSDETAAPTASETPSSTPTPTPEPSVVTVSAMGDMLPHDSVTADAETADGGYDYAQFFDTIKPVYDGSDLVYCNQEAPSGGVELGLSYFPAFNAPVEFAQGLSAAGCNTIGLGNNHTFDQGQEGIDRTREVWDALDPLLISGANRDAVEQSTVSFTEIDGVRVAFVSLVDLSNTPTNDFALNWLDDDELVDSLMTQAADGADATIVAVHWGEEYSDVVTDRQREQAARLADLGADVIIGTHPHVLQEAEWLDNADGSRSFVYYSLGNALATQMAIPRVLSAVAQFDLVMQPSGDVEVQSPRAVPTYMHFDLTPAQLDAGEWANRRNLQIYPLVDAAEPISRSAWRDDLTVESGIELVTDVLGPDVAIISPADAQAMLADPQPTPQPTP